MDRINGSPCSIAGLASCCITSIKVQFKIHFLLVEPEPRNLVGTGSELHILMLFSIFI